MATKVTFASDWTSSGGRTYKRETTADINDADARLLVRMGRARLATEDSKGSNDSAKAGDQKPNK